MSDENELYQQWRDTSDEQKRELEKRLYDAVSKHARAVIWQQLEEQNPDLAQSIAAAAIMRVPTFRQESKFSTWMEGVARKQIKQELRRRTRSRKVFDEYSDVFEHVDDEKELTDPQASAAFLEREQRILLETLRKELSPKEYVLLECMRESMSTPEIAARLKIADDAVESRRRRLMKKLQRLQKK
jgi:RNA polymerase sigma factor (sigma-70 family)